MQADFVPQARGMPHEFPATPQRKNKREKALGFSCLSRCLCASVVNGLKLLPFNFCKKILAQAYLRPSLSVLIWLKLPAFGGGGIQQGSEYPNTYLGSIK
ncbi:hypothetical protein [Undibacterium sp. YM2]|uniref:hypothetical protein n=1 Tax=Undibacterium sp. YM2 TaxID=2058625 RepID=UPI0013898AC0|nr:hypothetical protein [Undibacterium sp. YM2]